MKKSILIAMTAVAATVLVSCEHEKDFKDINPGENGIVFAPQGTSTRSADLQAPISRRSIPLAEVNKGERLFLEETVTMLDDAFADVPATRGTPAYTMNVGDLYPTMSVKALKNGTTVEAAAETEFSYQTSDAYQYYEGRYEKHATPWDKADDVYFFLKLPADMNGYSELTAEDDVASFGTEGGMSMSFRYISPDEATDQQDILFAGRSLTYEQYQDQYEKGHKPVPVLFHHALTAVKFRMGNELFTDETKTRTYITKVEFIGLVNSGICTVTPTVESSDSYADDPTSYSSATAVEWDYTDGTVTTAEAPIYQAFGDDDLVDYGTGDRKFPDSFYGYNQNVGSKDGLDKNLNNADAEMTFMLIPQEITENVQVKVTVQIWDGSKKNEAHEVTLDLGAKLAGQQWKAGELRTFTIKPNVVDVELTDKMDAKKYIKSDVRITNTGNVSEYVRANIVGNWVGKIWIGPGADDYSSSETILNGFTTENGNEMTPLWNDKDGLGQTQVPGYAPYPTNNYGTFDPALPARASLSGEHYAPETARHWIRIDKYFYHTTPIGPGEDLDPAAILFDTYEIKQTPEFWVADINGNRHKAKDVHLVLDIMVQVIVAPVKTEDPIEYEPYDKAWCDYLGVDMAGLGDL